MQYVSVTFLEHQCYRLPSRIIFGLCPLFLQALDAEATWSLAFRFWFLVKFSLGAWIYAKQNRNVVSLRKWKPSSHCSIIELPPSTLPIIVLWNQHLGHVLWLVVPRQPVGWDARDNLLFKHLQALVIRMQAAALRLLKAIAYRGNSELLTARYTWRTKARAGGIPFLPWFDPLQRVFFE